MDRLTDRWMQGQTDIRTDGQTDGWMTDRQTNEDIKELRVLAANVFKQCVVLTADVTQLVSIMVTIICRLLLLLLLLLLYYWF